MPVIGTIIKKAIEIKSNRPPEKKRKVSPQKQQERVLKKLLKKAQNTAFGEHYKFGEILRYPDVVNEFRKNIPTHDYNKIFREWWYRQLNGESFVTWPGKVKYYALSSGTSEASSKHIPVTGDMIKCIRRIGTKQLVSLANYDFPKEFYEKGILMLGGSTHLQYNGSYYEGDLSGINTAKIPFWFQHFYKPGRQIARERDWNTKLEEIVKSAPQWDIGSITGVPAWHMILFEMIIERYKLNNIHDIWPNLRTFCHGGVAFGPYKTAFEKLLAKPLVYLETYLASEGFIAYQSRPDATGMELVLNNGIFMEFVPFNETNFDSEGNIVEEPETFTIEQIEENKPYALLISTTAGAWRYLIGDVIKLIDKEYSEIVITGRTKHFLNICGEHMSQENMNRAIEILENQENVHIPEFTVAGIKHSHMFAHKWFIGTDDKITPEVARQRIDEIMKRLNDDYRVERIAAIKDVIVEILPSNTFYQYMEKIGRMGSQYKFPRVIKGKQLEDWEQFIKDLK